MTIEYRKQFEIDLAAKGVDPYHFDPHVVADAKLAAVAAAFDDAFSFVLVSVVIGKRQKSNSGIADTDSYAHLRAFWRSFSGSCWNFISAS